MKLELFGVENELCGVENVLREGSRSMCKFEKGRRRRVFDRCVLGICGF